MITCGASQNGISVGHVWEWDGSPDTEPPDLRCKCGMFAYVEYNDGEKLRSRITTLEDALREIVRLSTEWEANKMGGVYIHRKRWLRLAEIARAAALRSDKKGT